MKFEPRIEDLIEDLQPLADVVGIAAVQLLVRQFGGTRLFVPQKRNAQFETDVVPVLGETEADALIKVFGPTRLDVPRTPWSNEGRHRLVKECRARQMPVNAIALAMGIGWRAVLEIDKGSKSRLTLPRDERQADLVEMLKKPIG